MKKVGSALQNGNKEHFYRYFLSCEAEEDQKNADEIAVF